MSDRQGLVRPRCRGGANATPLLAAAGAIAAAATLALGVLAFVDFAGMALWRLIGLVAAVWLVASVAAAALLRAVRISDVRELTRWIVLLVPAGGALSAVYFVAPMLRSGEHWVLLATAIAFAIGSLLFGSFTHVPMRVLLPVLTALAALSPGVAALSDDVTQGCALVLAGFFSACWTLLPAVAGAQLSLWAARAKQDERRMRPQPGQLLAMLFAGMMCTCGAIRSAQSRLFEHHLHDPRQALGLAAGLCALAALALLSTPNVEVERSSVNRATVLRILRSSPDMRLLVAVSALSAATLASWDTNHPELLRRDGFAESIGLFGLLFLGGALLMVAVESVAARRERLMLVVAALLNVGAWLCVLPGAAAGQRVLADDVVANLLLEIDTSFVTFATVFLAQRAVAVADRVAVTVLVAAAKALGAILGAAGGLFGLDLFAGRHWLGVIAAGAAFATAQVLVSLAAVRWFAVPETARKRPVAYAAAAGFAGLGLLVMALVAWRQGSWAEEAQAAALLLDAGHSAGDGLGSVVIAISALALLARSRLSWSLLRWARHDLDLWARRVIVLLMCGTVAGVALRLSDFEATHDARFDALVLWGGCVGVGGNLLAFAVLRIGRARTGFQALGADAKHALIDAAGSGVVVAAVLLGPDYAPLAAPVISVLMVAIIVHEARHVLPRRWRGSNHHHITDNGGST